MLDYGAASKPRRVSLNLSQKFILGFLLLSLLLSGGVCLVGYQSIQAKYMDFYYRMPYPPPKQRRTLLRRRRRSDTCPA